MLQDLTSFFHNSGLFVILLMLCFGSVLFAKKFMGKAGLFAWIAIASIVSNITAALTGPMIIPLEYWPATFANISFATILLTNNILTKDYGIDEGKKGVRVTIFSAVIFCLFMGFAVMIKSPDVIAITDMLTLDEALKAVFGFTGNYAANNIASIFMLMLANLANIKMFKYLQEKLKKAPIANMFSNMICNCIENFGFVLLGLNILPRIFIALGSKTCGITDIKTALMIAITTCVFEVLISFITPLIMKLSDKIKCKE